MSFKIFIIDSGNNKHSSYFQDIAYSALLQSTLTNEAEILCVKLESALDWMPAGHIHVQGLGSMQIMFNFEGDLTEELILKMNQIHNKVSEIFKNNLKLMLHKAFISDGNDDELTAMYLSLQSAVGKMKYSDIQSELAQTLAEHAKNAEEHKQRGDTRAVNIANKYKEHLAKLGEAFAIEDVEDRRNKITLIKDEYRYFLDEMDAENKTELVASLAKQIPLRIKTAMLGFFSNRIADGYHVSQETEVDAQAIESPKPILSFM